MKTLLIILILMMQSLYGLDFLNLHNRDINVNENKFFTSGYRIVVSATITDQEGVYEARVYFKNSIEHNYKVFSLMECIGNECKSELPLTNISLKKMDYVIVYQNSSGNVYDSGEYTMEKRDMLELPSWQTLNKKSLKLYSEYAKPLKNVKGFTDDLTVQKSTGELLGVKAGLYTLELINPNATVDCSMCVGEKKEKKETDFFDIIK